MNNTPQDSSLGREVAYPAHYDPTLLFPIPRQGARDEIGIAADALPFVGHDRWHAYELSWLDARGKPRVATATKVSSCLSLSTERQITARQGREPCWFCRY